MIACRSHFRENPLFFIWAYAQCRHNVQLEHMLNLGIIFKLSIMLNFGTMPNWTCEFMAKFWKFFWSLILKIYV